MSGREPGPSPGSDVGALGVVVGGGGGRVPPALFGVVEPLSVLDGAGLGVQGAAGEHGAAQQGEDGAAPAGVQGEAERHEAFLLVGPDGEPDGGHQTAQAWGGEGGGVSDSGNSTRGVKTSESGKTNEDNQGVILLLL